MLHPVQPCGVEFMPFRNRSRLDVEKAAIDAIGRHEEGFAHLDQGAADLDQAVVGGDEEELGTLEGFHVQHALVGNLGALEIRDDLGKVLVKACVGARHILQLAPDLLPDDV